MKKLHIVIVLGFAVAPRINSLRKGDTVEFYGEY